MFGLLARADFPKYKRVQGELLMLGHARQAKIDPHTSRLCTPAFKEAKTIFDAGTRVMQLHECLIHLADGDSSG